MDVEKLARSRFYCPGPFNNDAFARDYIRFLILRKQCARYRKSGAINIRLAVNNCVVILNSFGKETVNKIIQETFNETILPIVGAILEFLEVSCIVATPDEEIAKMLTVVKKSNEFRKT